MEGGGGAYGAGKAGGPFDPVAFIKKPQVILRLVSWVFSIIVFGCIASVGSWEGFCQYNNDPNACSYGIGIGVIAFLGLIALLVLDALFDNISSVQQRKYVVIGDMAFSGLWAFLWFVCFCYLTDQWRKTPAAGPNVPWRPPDDRGRSGIEAAIAFSFFSIGTFVGLAVLAVLRYRQGAADAFASPGYMGDGTTQPTPSPYSSYPGGESGDPYQQPPFAGVDEPKQMPPGDYQQPTY